MRIRLVWPQGSVLHEGQGGGLYTWGGVNESVAFGSSEKHDSNKVRRPWRMCMMRAEVLRADLLV